MKSIKSLKGIMIGLYSSLKRFPITILLTTTVAVILIILSELQPTAKHDLLETIGRITMVIALGIPLSLCIKLLFERKSKGPLVLLGLYHLAGALVLLLYYFFLMREINMVTVSRYIAVSLALYLGFLFIPHIPDKKQFEMYIIKVFTGFFTTIIYSVVLYLGLSAILFTIDKLLGIRIIGKIYYYTGLFVACTFAPSYFLAGIPLKDEQAVQENYPKLLKVLLLYIVMPLLSAYTAILYIYFIKIVVSRQWPVGLVSHLVLWYSVIIAAVLFFITPLKDENRWAGRFAIWLPKLILPILIMMFISIGIRINAYGMTENRYYVIILGLWSSGIMLYYCFAGERKNIILPVSLSILAFLSVFGPWSSYSISKYSQNTRFARIVIRNQMLTKGELQPASSGISKEDKVEISRILDYFENNHSLKEMRYLPRDYKRDNMEKVFGFPYESPQYAAHGTFFFYERADAGAAMNISGYDALYDARALFNPNGNGEVIYDPQSAVIKINHQGNEIYTKDLKSYAGQLVEKYKAEAKQNFLPPEAMVLDEENEKVKVRFIFLNISGNSGASGDDIRIDSVDFYLLIKFK